jgi:hypothetical protein
MNHIRQNQSGQSRSACASSEQSASVALCLRVLRAIGVPTSIVEEFKNRQQHNPMQYDVIRATEIEELIAKVNAAIKKGFVPLGGVEITNVTQARPQPAFAFMQAVVKES